MAHISTTARKFRKQTREIITKQMYDITHKTEGWEFLNPVTNNTVIANAIDVTKNTTKASIRAPLT